jgi:RecA-family ATPase
MVDIHSFSADATAERFAFDIFSNVIFRRATEEEKAARQTELATCRGAAIALAYKYGWHVFPVKFVGTAKKSYKSAEHSGGARWGMTADPDQIYRDFSRWFNAGVGVPTGEINLVWAVDADTVEGGHRADGVSTMKILQEEHGALPDTLTAISPSGSVHWYFNLPEGVTIKNSTGKIGPGVDVRGEGGMVVAPPTRKKRTVHPYRWLSRAPVADAPQWLIDLATAPDPQRTDDGGPHQSGEAEAEISRIAEAVALIPNDDLDWESWNTTGMTVWRATGGGEQGRRIFHAWSQRSDKYDYDYTESKWNEYFKYPPNQVGAGSIFHRAEEACPGYEALAAFPDHDVAKSIAAFMKEAGIEVNDGDDETVERVAEQIEQQHRERDDADALDYQACREDAANPPPKAFGRLRAIDMRTWDDVSPPEQEWAVRWRIPLECVALFSGEGGTGKSIIGLQMAVDAVRGAEWFGAPVKQGPALIVEAEEGEKVIHRRLFDILDHHGLRFADVRRDLHVVSLKGEDAVLAAANHKSGTLVTSPLYKSLLEMAGDVKPVLTVIASSADVYAGSEMDRSLVRQFVGLLTRVAIAARGSLVLISHPSLTGISSGSGLSGSTQWHNAVRARFYLKTIKPKKNGDDDDEAPDTNLREIQFHKNQYGPTSESIALRYQSGLFLPVTASTADEAAREAGAEQVFLSLLTRFTYQKQHLSPNAKANNYAPHKIATQPEARGFRKRELETAMQRLLDQEKIHIDDSGPPSRQTQRLILGPRKLV